MRRPWLITVTVAAIGLLAGIMIAGRPTDTDQSVISAVPTTEAATTSPDTTAASTTQPAVDRTGRRIVAADASATAGSAQTIVDRLIGLGYTEVTAAADLDTKSAVSAIYYRDGFEAAGLQLAADLGLAVDVVVPLPADSITDADASGDLILVIGDDLAG
jgi:hypothetical protein